MKYKVIPLINDQYQVILTTYSYTDSTKTNGSYLASSKDERVVYQGRLSDCEAFIRLSEGGYLNNFTL